MKISKQFTWEMGHRLQFHNGLCKNLHGHSYKMIVTLEGEVNQNGILVDFYDVFKLVSPIIQELDHSFICDKSDKELIDSLQKLGSKISVIDTTTTVENICKYIADRIANEKLPNNLSKLTVIVYETEDAFAEYSIDLN
ncbi:MAG: 6-carboxytetrahydropterin synthase [Ignavibacteria bacterium]|nr:6-carboxytetrahydropterin synthase [Ignavibacteria bacterium]